MQSTTAPTPTKTAAHAVSFAPGPSDHRRSRGNVAHNPPKITAIHSTRHSVTTTAAIACDLPARRATKLAGSLAERGVSNDELDEIPQRHLLGRRELSDRVVDAEPVDGA